MSADTLSPLGRRLKRWHLLRATVIVFAPIAIVVYGSLGAWRAIRELLDDMVHVWRQA